MTTIGLGAPLSRRRLLAGAGGLAAAGMLIRWPHAEAAVRIEVTEGNVEPLPVALPDFVGGAPVDGEAARSVTQVITADLKRSGLFAPIDPAAYIEKVVNIDNLPRFQDWRVLRPGPRHRAAHAPGRRTAQDRVSSVGRVCRPAANGPAIFHHPR